MIKFVIDKIGDGVISVSLTSSAGGKISHLEDGTTIVQGITKKFPVKLVLQEGEDYYITDNKLNYLSRQIDEFNTD